MDRIKRKIRRKQGLLLACFLLLFFTVGMLVVEVDALGNSKAYFHNGNFCSSCTEIAYIGLDARNYLTLYDGHPMNGKVVRRLFQLDIKSIEGTLPIDTMKQLVNGIQVQDEIEYNSVLSSFSDYAIGVVE